MSEQQKLISVEYRQLKGLKDVKINFGPKQVTGIFGVNGCGKSTILHSLLCFYKPKNDTTRNYLFSNFFKTTADTNWSGSGMTVKYSYRDNRTEKEESKFYHKRIDRWAPKYSSRPDRYVFFLGINSCVPDIEEFSKSGSRVDLEAPENIAKRDEILRAACSIMNFNYTDVKDQPVKLSKKKCRIVRRGGIGTDMMYTSLNMGAGEQRMFRIIEMLINAPKYSLIIIDEIDLTLHTAALNRLMNFIVGIAERNHLQVVFTSHREELVGRTDINIRHLLQTNEGTLCLENTTPECIDRITGEVERTLDVFVEDDVAEAIVSKLCRDLNIRKRVSIHRFGAIDNAFIASVGMDILGKDTSKMLFVLDGDRYRTGDERKDMMEQKYSGNERDKAVRREKALSLITQLCIPEGKTPDEYICEVLQKSEGENEIVECARSILGVADKHEYINRIVDSIGEPRNVGLFRIIDEMSKNTDTWNVMTKDVEDWLQKKKYENGL